MRPPGNSSRAVPRAYDREAASRCDGRELAGSAAVAAPKLHILNPIAQGKRIDLHTNQVCRRALELVARSTPDLHKHWMLSANALERKVTN